MKTRITALALAMIFAIGLATGAAAASAKSEQAADYLYCVGLFNGKENDAAGNPVYDLDGPLTRHEALVMLVRLLGSEKEALAGQWKHPFKDVPAWAEKYVGYAYTKGITDGLDETHFGGENVSTEAQYVTFVLRALGYSDTNGDFSWNNPYKLSDSFGITSAGEEKLQFNRGEAVCISYNALSKSRKGTHRSLEQVLKQRRVIPATETIRLPSEGISLAQGSSAEIWVYQSDRYNKVELWADWTNGEKASVEWSGKWPSPARTYFTVKGLAPGTTTITVTYSKGGNEKATESMTVQVY